MKPRICHKPYAIEVNAKDDAGAWMKYFYRKGWEVFSRYKTKKQRDDAFDCITSKNKLGWFQFRKRDDI